MWEGGTPTEAPVAVIAQARFEEVAVQLKGFPGGAIAFGDDAALRIAQHIAVATREFWPQAAVPVEVELHVMPSNSSYSFRRRIVWREGMPFYLTLFAPATAAQDRFASTAVHELYHVLAGRWRLGSKDLRAVADPAFALVLEETTASLFGDCATLLVEASLSLPTVDTTLVLRERDGVQRTIKGTFSKAELRELLAGTQKTAPTSLMEKTVLTEVFGANKAITLDSPQADALLELCRQSARDPFYLKDWLTALTAE